MSYSDTSLRDFVSRLSTKAPVPGGGGASALVGAVGTALGCMVGSLTVGKKKYAAVEPEIRELMDRSLTLQSELLALIDKDAEAFEPLAKAYGLPAATEEEKARKAEVMAVVLKDACAVPMEIMEKCCAALELTKVFAEKGSVIAVSDAGVSASLCVAALKGAALNVFINTKAMADRALAESLNDKANAMLDTYVPMGEGIFDLVRSKLKK
ncbi:MAG: cyclodeaminase/cyclohydrolase family protein [Ruminococcaceae bacterium]|jgi:formiminotetrahydrofolate cyclodeaminase|nr:cyclodeaminase/cyclohydrolase family protein [Oscillospiraceae bacterium]